MIDTHCHVLWGVDDASTTLEQSLDMLRLAQVDGIETIVCTSHVKYPYYQNTLQSLSEACRELQEQANQHNIKIELIVGGENYISQETFPLLDQGKFVSIANKNNYMLVEFAWKKNNRDHPTIYIKELLKRNIIPIVAHPERYEWVHDDYSILKLWKDLGCMLQVNRTSLLGLDKIAMANEFAMRMLDDELIDLIASDAHAPYAPRFTKLSDVYKFVANRCGEEKAELYFVDNPKKTIG